MPCVSVRNNHARKASIKAANIERKNNRENTRLAKKQQSVAAKTAKVQAKNDTKALKARQSLEKRVTKKHQARRAKVKATRAKTLKVQAKTAARATKLAAKTQAKAVAQSAKTAKIAAKTQSKTAAQAAKLAKSQAKSQSRTAKVNQLKTSLKKVKLPQLKPAVSKTISKLSAAKSTRAQAKTAAKSAKAQAKAAKISAKKQIKAQKSQELSAETSRVAKISGASVQSSFKIPHARAESQNSASNYTPVYSHAPTRTVTYPAAPAYAPKPLRRTAFMTRGDLINAESRLGSTIFGPIPAGHRREFFHDQENIWIWFESWRDETDHPRQLTVRYEVRPSGVYKKISAGSYFKLTGDELENFRRATHAYLHIIKKYLYPNVATK